MPSAGVPIVAPPGGQVSQREFIYGRLTSEQRSVGLIIHHLHPVGSAAAAAVLLSRRGRQIAQRRRLDVWKICRPAPVSQLIQVNHVTHYRCRRPTPHVCCLSCCQHADHLITVDILYDFSAKTRDVNKNSAFSGGKPGPRTQKRLRVGLCESSPSTLSYLITLVLNWYRK